MSKILLYRDLIKYGIYAGIGLLFIVIVSMMGRPSQDPPLDSSKVFCRPTGDSITAAELNEKLKGKGVFEGKGNAFITSGQRHGVDPVLVAAIAMHETGHGKSKMVRTKNNPGGLFFRGEFMRFPTLEAGIEKMTQNLAKNYVSKGLKTPEQIGPKYAPIGAKNDPTGLNRFWIPTVTKYVNELGGLSYDCKAEDVQDVGKVSASGFLRPSTGQRTSSFGPRWGRMHQGIDFSCRTKEEKVIRAAKSGKVVVSTFGQRGKGFGGYGNVILIDHGGGVQTLYGHLAQRHVKVGDYIAQGQEIGVCGATGRSTGPHLHFEVRIAGKKVNPSRYIN